MYLLLYKTNIQFTVVSLTVCFDLELEGSIHFGKDIMRRLNNELPLQLSALEGPPSRSLVQIMAAEPYDTVQRSKIVKKDISNKPSDKDGKVPPIFKMVGSTPETIVKPNHNSTKAAVKDDGYKVNLKHRLIKKGSHRLKTLAYFIKNNLGSYANTTTILKNAINDYLSSVETYYDFISKRPIKYDIGKEFLVLDMIETANQILLNVAKKLLDDIIAETNVDKTELDMPYYVEKIKNTIIMVKQDQLRHVCDTLQVCRPFPGLCDHVADLLSEILQLNDDRIIDIIKSYEEAITVKRDFFKTLTNSNVYNIISSKLKDSFPNIAFMKEILSILRAVITQRYKVFKSNSLGVKIKTKAVRILLDVIDKAFEVNNDELNDIEIQNTINGYQQWAAGERSDLNLITKKFIYNAVEILKYSWSKETIEEVKVLTDVIFTGTTNNTMVYDYLFKKGSALVRDEENINLHSDNV